MQLKNDAKNINKKMNWNKFKIRIWNKQFTQGSRFTALMSPYMTQEIF